MRIILAGGSGFVGRHLAKIFSGDGHEVIVLSRSDRTIEHAKVIAWTGESLGDWANLLDGADAVVNLSGESVSLKWTSENKRKILDSRVKSTETLGKAIHNCRVRPKVWINASATGYYGDQGDAIMDETSPAGEGFLAETCVAWERAQDMADTPGVRKVKVRTGIVLGEEGGAFTELRKFTGLFLGGSQGDGRQWMSWIHLKDLGAVYRWAIESDFKGPVNAVCPNPVQNRDFMFALRDAMGKPWSPPAPKFALQVFGSVAGVEASVLLQSQRVVSKVLKEDEFRFRFEQLQPAFRDLLGLEEPLP